MAPSGPIAARFLWRALLRQACPLRLRGVASDGARALSSCAHSADPCVQYASLRTSCSSCGRCTGKPWTAGPSVALAASDVGERERRAVAAYKPLFVGKEGDGGRGERERESGREDLGCVYRRGETCTSQLWNVELCGEQWDNSGLIVGCRL